MPPIQGTRRGSRGLWDTEQVEVYRGPQSTLAGRAALAGATYVNTKDPVFRFEAAARGMGGEDETSTGAGMVNVPLIEEQVARRVAAEYQRSESALNYPTYKRFDRFGDFKEDEFLSVRSKLRIQPKALPRTRALLIYSYAEDGPDVSDIGGPVLGFAFDEDRGDFNTPIFSEVRRTTVHSGGLEIVQELTSALRLTAQTGFSRSDTERPSLNAGTPGETNILTGDFLQHLFTQEFRLNDVGVGWLFGRAWARPAAPLLSFDAAGISLCALLAGFFVLGVTTPLDRLLLLGRPGPHALALLLGSLLWPSFAVLGSLYLARGWRVCPRYVRVGGLLAAAVYLLIAGVLTWRA